MSNICDYEKSNVDIIFQYGINETGAYFKVLSIKTSDVSNSGFSKDNDTETSAEIIVASNGNEFSFNEEDLMLDGYILKTLEWVNRVFETCRKNNHRYPERYASHVSRVCDLFKIDLSYSELYAVYSQEVTMLGKMFPKDRTPNKWRTFNLTQEEIKMKQILEIEDIRKYFLEPLPAPTGLSDMRYVCIFNIRIKNGEFKVADERLKELLTTWGKSDKNADNKALYDRIANLLIKMETEAMACSFNGDIENLVKEKAQEYNRQLAILVDKISIFISTYAFLAPIIKREFNGNELLDDKEIVYSFVDEIVNDKHRYAYMKITPGNVMDFFDIVFSSNIVSGYDVRYIYQFNYTFSKKDELRNSQYILNDSVLVTVLKALPMPVLEEINKNFDISIDHLFFKWFNKK